MYQSRLYESHSVAHYVAMCVRDDRLLSGNLEAEVQIFRTKRGKYGVKFKV